MSSPVNPSLAKKIEEIGRNHVASPEVAKTIQELKPQKKTSEIIPDVSTIWYEELAKLDLPTPSWIVDKLLPDASITIISAPPAQYKTWLAYDIAIKVASGEPVFGHFVTKQTKVLIVDEESGLPRVRDRLQQLGISPDAKIAVTSSKDYFKLNEETVKSLITYCNDEDIGLVIFDSLTRIHTADENSAKDMSIVMGDLKRLAKEGIAVFLIHHNRKPGQFGGGGANEMRGSGDILAACDVQISVRRKAGSSVVTIFQNKNRDAADLAPFDLEVHSDEDSFWFEYLGSATKRKTRDEEVDEAIIAYLREHGRSALPDIQAALNNVAGKTKIAKRLDVLADENKLMLDKVAHGGKYYELTKEQTNG